MMQIWLGNSLPEVMPPSAVTIGNFDGVHLGHRHILQHLNRQACLHGLLATVVVFEPQPQEFFARTKQLPEPCRLTPLRDKLALLAQSGLVDAVWVVRFRQEFADILAQDFIDNILINKLNVKYLLIGDDFRFGRGRVGNFDMLSQQGGFVTERKSTIAKNGLRVSSTLIRQHLSDGNLAKAVDLLGHGYSLSGHVKHGAKLGRMIDCPTANIHLPRHRYALSGVFVVIVEGTFGKFEGVASFGVNPTVSQTQDTKLEVHLFDFSGNLYGQRLRVYFLHKIRDEQKFADVTELRQQIKADMAYARYWLSVYSGN